MKKIIRSIALFLALVTVFMVPVSAENSSNNPTINILDYCTPNNSGGYSFSVSPGTHVSFNFGFTFSPVYIDALVRVTGDPLKYVDYGANSTAIGLVLLSIGNGLYRLYANGIGLPTDYCELVFWGGNSTVEILSFKLSPNKSLVFAETGKMVIGSSSTYTMSSTSSSVTHYFAPSSSGAYIAHFSCPDWKMYDYLDFFIYGYGAEINSIIGRFGSFECPTSVTHLVAGGTWNEPRYSVMVRLDLSDLDRTKTDVPQVEISGIRRTTDSEYYISLLAVSGGIEYDASHPLHYYFSGLEGHISSLFDSMAQRQDAYHRDQINFYADNLAALQNIANVIRTDLAQTQNVISSQITQLKDNLISALSSLQTALSAKFDDLQGSMEWWFGNIRTEMIELTNIMVGFLTEKFDIVVNRLDQILHPDTSQSEQFEEEIASQATEMEEIGDTLDSVTKPPVEELNPSVDEIVSPADVGEYTSILQILLGNQIFLSVCLMSLTLALVSYTLYGKR